MKIFNTYIYIYIYILYEKIIYGTFLFANFK